MASIGGIILLIVAAWIFSSVRSNSREADALKQGLDSYTGSIKAVLQTITEPATDMSAAAVADPKTVADSADGWVKFLQEAQTQMGAVVPPAGGEIANEIFLQSIASYLNAAQTLKLAGDLPAEDATKLITTTLGEVSTATALWDTGVNALDEERSAADLGSSGIRSPASGTPTAQPTPEVSPSPSKKGGGND
ncbi:MAG: hypothetical protein QOK47_101 [Actinomycetota bacterium]|nr:hypothetical protein [Actinomycetota bacterium]